MRDIERGLNMHPSIEALLTDPDTGRLTDIDELAPANDEREIPENTDTFEQSPYPILDKIRAAHESEMAAYRKWREAEETPPPVLYRYPVVFEPKLMFPVTSPGAVYCNPVACGFATFVIV